jgi:LemA protein
VIFVVVVVSVGLVVVGGLWIRRQYRRLVMISGRADVAWASIVDELAQRAVLVPQLLATMRQHVPQAHEMVDDLAAALDRELDAAAPQAAAVAAACMADALGQVLELGATTHTLLADASFVKLRAQLTVVEQSVIGSGKRFNAAALQLNNALDEFPTSAVARLSTRFMVRECFAVPVTT